MRLLLLAGLILWGCSQGELKNTRSDSVAKTQDEPPVGQADSQVDSQADCENEWTAEPPTRGEPKVLGPPYPHLSEDSRCGLFDKLRKFRWQVWEYEQAIMAEKKYLDLWIEWKDFWYESTFAGRKRIDDNSGPVCGDWGEDWEKIYKESGRRWWSSPGFWAIKLQKVVTQYEDLHPTPGIVTSLSFGNDRLVRSYGGEAVSSWLAKLNTIVGEIAELERSNGEGIRQIERFMLRSIEGCEETWTLNVCPHPIILWNISDGFCDD